MRRWAGIAAWIIVAFVVALGHKAGDALSLLHLLFVGTTGGGGGW